MTAPLKPLRAVLVHRNSSHLIDRTTIGWWSYPVPEFEWGHCPVRYSFRLNRSQFVSRYDLIVIEDGKLEGILTKDADIPVAYVVADSTLSERHYQTRCQQAAKNADMLLVDWDKLSRFAHLKLPAHRFSWAVNDKFFYPREKKIDVGFFGTMTPERKQLSEFLKKFCQQRGYSYACGRRVGPAYAEAIGSAKININLGRNPQTRTNRVFDVFLSKSCLVCDPLPDVSDEPRSLNEHYLQFRSRHELEGLLDELLREGTWAVFAEAAYELGKRHYTWGQRAKQLREVLGGI